MHFEGGGGEAALMSSGDMVFSEEMPRDWKIFLTQFRNLENFSVTKILREIYSGSFKTCNTVILMILYLKS